MRDELCGIYTQTELVDFVVANKDEFGGVTFAFEPAPESQALAIYGIHRKLRIIVSPNIVAGLATLDVKGVKQVPKTKYRLHGVMTDGTSTQVPICETYDNAETAHEKMADYQVRYSIVTPLMITVINPKG